MAHKKRPNELLPNADGSADTYNGAFYRRIPAPAKPRAGRRPSSKKQLQAFRDQLQPFDESFARIRAELLAILEDGGIEIAGGLPRFDNGTRLIPRSEATEIEEHIRSAAIAIWNLNGIPANIQTWAAFIAGCQYIQALVSRDVAPRAMNGKKQADNAAIQTVANVEAAHARHATWINWAEKNLLSYRDENGTILREKLYRAVADHFWVGERRVADILRPWINTKE